MKLTDKVMRVQMTVTKPYFPPFESVKEIFRQEAHDLKKFEEIYGASFDSIFLDEVEVVETGESLFTKDDEAVARWLRWMDVEDVDQWLETEVYDDDETFEYPYIDTLLENLNRWKEQRNDTI